jgi:hypothetical protein
MKILCQAFINSFYLIYYVWPKVSRVNTDHHFLANIRVIPPILYAEVVGNASSVGGVI